jgi:hypothetical protein
MERTMAENFFKLPQVLCERTDLTSSAKIVYAVIVNSIGTKQESWIGHRKIAKLAGVSRRTVSACTEHLGRVGILQIERRDNGQSCLYSIPEKRRRNLTGEESAPVKNLHGVCEKTAPEAGKNLPHKRKNQVKEPNTVGFENSKACVGSIKPKAKKKSLDYPEDFEKFWKKFRSVSPDSHGSKKNAFTQWKKISKDTKVTELIDGVDRFEAYHRRLRSKRQFEPAWKHAERWLKARDWEFIPEAQRGDADYIQTEDEADKMMGWGTYKKASEG